MIISWSGSIESIPVGFALCDGTNGTPDLRNRFIMGAMDTMHVNQTGGASNVELAASNLPTHTHEASSTFVGDTLPNHAHNVYDPGHTHPLGQDNTNKYCYQGPYQRFGSMSSGSCTTNFFTGTGTTSISIDAASGGTPSGIVTTTIQSNGSSTPFSILPPFYALAYIMKL